MKKVISIINGPNLNMLGTREPTIYGSTTLDQIKKDIEKRAKAQGFEVDFFQSNSEGDIVNEIQRISSLSSALVINPAAYTHTSVAIRDAVSMLDIPVVEIHISNIYKREDFRKKSLISDVATGLISGFGTKGYELALDAAVSLIK